MEDQNFQKIEQLLKETRSIDSARFHVDKTFKESLREKIYSFYLSQKTKGGSIMDKFKGIFLNKKQLLLASFAVISLLVIVSSGTVFFLSNRDKTEESKSEVLLAANLAVVDGTVQVKPYGEDRWIEAKQDDTLNQGDSIRTLTASRAVLELDNGDAIRLNSSSEVLLESLDPSEVIVNNVSGEVYSRVMKSDVNIYMVKAENIEAKARGTAYTVSNNVTDQKITVGVIESAVVINKDNTQVTEGKVAVYDEQTDKIEIIDYDKEELKNSEFLNWNKEKDTEKGYNVGCLIDVTPPEVVITEPADGSTTTVESITVKGITEIGALVKINGGEVANNEGNFEATVALQLGENTIEIKASDSYNNVTTITLKVTRKEEIVNPPAPTVHVNVSNAYAEGGKVKVSWGYDNYRTIDGFKLVAGNGYYPKYPDHYDKYAYIPGQDSTYGEITGLQNGTYWVAVCGYNASTGRCYDDLYSWYYSVTVEGQEEGGTTTAISLAVTSAGAGKVNLTWSANGTILNGFKILLGSSSDLNYPTPNDWCQWIGSDQTSFIKEGLKSGQTYYFRVCEYENGTCGVKSEAILFTVE